jgi:hypothetical protein
MTGRNPDIRPVADSVICSINELNGIISEDPEAWKAAEETVFNAKVPGFVLRRLSIPYGRLLVVWMMFVEGRPASIASAMNIRFAKTSFRPAGEGVLGPGTD